MRAAIFFSAIMITDHMRGTADFSDFYSPFTSFGICLLIVIFLGMDIVDFLRENSR